MTKSISKMILVTITVMSKPDISTSLIQVFVCLYNDSVHLDRVHCLVRIFCPLRCPATYPLVSYGSHFRPMHEWNLICFGGRTSRHWLKLCPEGVWISISTWVFTCYFVVVIDAWCVWLIIYNNEKPTQWLS